MAAAARRLVESLSVRGLAGACAAAGSAVIGCALAIRQQSHRDHPVFAAAREQLTQSEAVHAVLGDSDVSTSGIIGGYTDVMGGTAVLRIPLTGARGTTIYARVEAEAEWLGKPPEEVTATPPEVKVHSRWLLRHLELEPHACNEQPVVLYSISAHAPPSKWAPSRESSALPEPLRNLLPNMQTLVADNDTHRFVLTLGIAIAANAFAFAYLHRRARGIERSSQVMEMIRLPVNEALLRLRNDGMRVAEQVADRNQLQPMPNSGIYGRETPNELYAIVPVVSPSSAYDMLLSARRSQGDSWKLTHVSLTHQDETKMALTQGELARTDDRDAAQVAVSNMIAAAKSLPLQQDTRPSSPTSARRLQRKGKG